jgi:hypothetical protein
MSLAQPDSRIRLAEKQVARYREDVVDWQSAHDALARSCWPIEDLINNGTHYLRSILRLDAVVREATSPPQADIDALLAVRYHLRGWLQISMQVLADVDSLEREYGQVEGAALFRDDIDAVRKRLDSTRSVQIDEFGRVFGLGGELICLPGLTPADILESLEDEREGRLIPLAD